MFFVMYPNGVRFFGKILQKIKRKFTEGYSEAARASGSRFALPVIIDACEKDLTVSMRSYTQVYLIYALGTASSFKMLQCRSSSSGSSLTFQGVYTTK